MYKKILIFQNLIELLSFKYLFKGYTYGKLLKIAKNYEVFIPRQFQQEMKGIADVISDITYEDILLQNCFFDILYGYIIPKNPKKRFSKQYEFGCTSFGAISHNKPLIGQNFDYPIFFKPTASFVHLITPELSEIFSLRLGSLLSLPMGINRFSVSVRVNIIKSYMKAVRTIPTSIISRLALEKSINVEEFFRIITNNRRSGSCNLIISDNSKIIAMETLPRYYLREEVEDIIVKSNTFNSRYFQKYLLDPKYSKKRQQYAESQLKESYEENNGRLTEKDLLKIMADDPIICRLNWFKPMTLAFLTNEYFGLGNPKNDKLGMVPL